MKHLLAKLLWAILIVVLAGLITIPPYLYLTGLGDLPIDREPLADIEIPESVSRSYWRFLMGDGNPLISPKNPYGFLFDIYAETRRIDENQSMSAELALLSDATRSLMFREMHIRKPNNWHLSNASAMIWTSRNWSAREAIDTTLQDAYFGNDFQGIDEAARGYLGVSLEELTDIQVAYLLIIKESPNRYNPWCYPENHRERFEEISGRIGYTTKYESIEGLPAPHHACAS